MVAAHTYRDGSYNLSTEKQWDKMWTEMELDSFALEAHSLLYCGVAGYPMATSFQLSQVPELVHFLPLIIFFLCRYRTDWKTKVEGS